jgi:hypothetical protein
VHPSYGRPYRPVFGAVPEHYRRHLESLLYPVFSSRKPELLFLFVEEEPRDLLKDEKVATTVIAAKVVTPILEKAQAILEQKSKHREF